MLTVAATGLVLSSVTAAICATLVIGLRQNSSGRKRQIRLAQLSRDSDLNSSKPGYGPGASGNRQGVFYSKTSIQDSSLLRGTKSTLSIYFNNFMKDPSKEILRMLSPLKEIPVLRIGAIAASTRIEKACDQRLREACMNDLPQMVDILSLSLGAGLSIDQAFEWYLNTYDTPLADQFRRAEQSYQVGMLSRMKAFEELAESLQEEAVLRFVNALRQAFSLGSPLGPALDALGHEVRKYRVVRIEERIAKTPVKILVPLGLCIVPAVLILLMGPIMSQVMQGFQI